ncbi:MAG: DUF1501 domain-containing protein [Lautropia sp.]|nr:DUF1501 domain-containing protein [Lautropia sp.]
MTHTHSPSRRQLLKSGLGLAALTGPTAFALDLTHMSAMAAESAGSNDYKALICLFLYGGNDQSNTVLDTRPDAWREYERMRVGSIGLGAPGSAKNAVLPVRPNNLSAYGNAGVELALHPQLVKTRELFRQRRLAVVANVGPLIEPTTPDQYRQRLTRLPPHLYSHNDQQSVWQTMHPEGSHPGWGGRMMDMLASANNSSTLFASAISPSTLSYPWLNGRAIQPYSIPLAGDIGIQLVGHLNRQAIKTALRDILSERRDNNLLVKTYQEVHRRILDYQDIMTQNVVPDTHASLLPIPPESNGHDALTRQLRAVARVIASRQNLGVKRQVFFVHLAGFDTHDNQLGNHGRLMTQLDLGLDYFDRQMKALGVANQVTMFTASEFGRGMTSNGTGTDHGWGSHHFVCGGAVNGGMLYGRFPNFGKDAGDDVDGRLVPQFSVEQYAASLGRWFGLSTSDLHQLFPNLFAFSSSPSPDFMKA